jgi:hypothetical protein
LKSFALRCRGLVGFNFGHKVPEIRLVLWATGRETLFQVSILRPATRFDLIKFIAKGNITQPCAVPEA